MAWDPNRPQNNEKIRDMGQTVFRPFWDAIQTASEGIDADQKLLQWGVNLLDRTSTIVSPNDPSQIETQAGDKAGVLYTKTVNSQLELFFMNSEDSNNVIQLTSGTPTVATNGESSLPGGLGIKWGKISGIGLVNVVYVTEGLTDFPTQTLNVLATTSAPGTTIRGVHVVDASLANTGFNLRVDSATSGTFWFAIGN